MPSSGLDPALVASLALFVGALTFGVKLIVPELVKLIREVSASMRSRADAKLEADTAARLDAQARAKDAENTGRFLTATTNDRKQIDSLVSDVRAEVRKCHDERLAERAERLAERELYERRIAELERRVEEIEASRDALFVELQLVRRSIDSGGAYAPRRE